MKNNCPHTNTRLELMPEGSQHYAKVICSDCGKFLRWEKHPRTVEREKSNAGALVRLRKDERLTQWEREFVASVEGQGPKLSPKQQRVLETIAGKYV